MDTHESPRALAGCPRFDKRLSASECRREFPHIAIGRDMHPYRTHHCGQLRASDVGSKVRISGWIHRKRDHGGVLFIDLRDHYGITQVVADQDNPVQKLLDSLKLDAVVTVTGDVVARSPEALNPKLPTGEIEVVAREVEVCSSAAELPMPGAGEGEYTA